MNRVEKGPSGQGRSCVTGMRSSSMGITIVQKSDLKHPRPNPKTALVLSGGGISGGAFKLGGLQALSTFMLNRNIGEFDIYVGVSAGALLAAFLANGISPEELAKGFEGERGRIGPIPLSRIYSVNYSGFIWSPIHTAGQVLGWLPRFGLNFIMSNNIFRKEFRKTALKFIGSPSYENAQELFRYCLRKGRLNIPHPSLPWGLIPNGIFSTDSFERALRKNFRKSGLQNDFRALYRKTGRALYIFAMNLNNAEREVFGHDENGRPLITKAMQASIAIPVFYAPVKIDGVDYVDGAVIKTTSMDLAVSKGADLIICYNPFRPFNYETFCEQCEVGENRLRIAEDGMYAVFNQAMRTMLHTRLMHGINTYVKNPDFKGDIILIEPTEYDADFFDMNPLTFWGRRDAAKRGFRSVSSAISGNYDRLRRILSAYGVRVNPKFKKASVETPESEAGGQGSNILPEEGFAAAVQ